MLASQKGQVDCVKMLLDRGAEINMQEEVSGVIYMVCMQCSMYPESAVVDEDMRKHFIWVFLSCYFISASID